MEYHTMGFGDLSSIITGVDFSEWCQTVTIACVYNPSGEHRAYKIVFYGCSRITLEKIDIQQHIADSVELLGIQFGAKQHQQPALINTDTFELTVWYDHYRILQ